MVIFEINFKVDFLSTMEIWKPLDFFAGPHRCDLRAGQFLPSARFGRFQKFT